MLEGTDDAGFERSATALTAVDYRDLSPAAD